MIRRGRSKTKVLLEIPALMIGGVERFLQGLLAKVDRGRFEPVLLSSRDGEVLGIFKSCGVRSMVLDYIRDPAGLVRFLQDERIDAAQTNCLCFSLALAAREAGVPHVWRVGGRLELAQATYRAGPERPAASPEAFLFSDVGVAAQSILRLSDKVVCPSRYLRAQFETLGDAQAGKLRVIRNGVDLELVDRESGGSAFQGPCAPPRVGMIARFLEQKRPLDFIRAARLIADRVPEAEFVLFGGVSPRAGERTYAGLLARERRRLGLEGKLRFQDCIERRFEAYRDMSLFVLPSVREGASNAILEAMALGRPVVAARSGANAELVLDGRTGFLVPPESPEAIAAAVIRILKDSRLAARLGRSARRRAEERLDVADAARAYEALWLEVSRRGARAGGNPRSGPGNRRTPGGRARRNAAG
jgi:glycosyltransferase involved in cell wall biosynthesis